MPINLSGSVPWLVAAGGAAFLAVSPAAHRTGGDKSALDRLVTDELLAAVLGSRLIYLLTDPVTTLHEPLRLLLLHGILAAWGAAAGAVLVLAYHTLLRPTLRGPTAEGAVLLLVTVVPFLFMAWRPAGIQAVGPFAAVGPYQPVTLYYGTAASLAAVAFWLWPRQLLSRYTTTLGVLFLFLDIFRQAPLIGGLVTNLQVAGIVLVGTGLCLPKSPAGV